LIFTSPAGAVAKYRDEYFCLYSVFVCLSARISRIYPEPHSRYLPNVSHVLPTSVRPWLGPPPAC